MIDIYKDLRFAAIHSVKSFARTIGINVKMFYSWANDFCRRKENGFYCVVDSDYMMDRFNWTDLEDQVLYYHQAVNIIISDIEDITPSFSNVMLRAAENLYGLLHARYIVSQYGIVKMIRKYNRGEFGFCLRVHCENQPMFPIGLNDIPGEEMVKCYCPKCMEVYTPAFSWQQHADGAHFGTAFPHLVLMQYPELRPMRPTRRYHPRLFGFPLHSSAYESIPSDQMS